MSGKGRRRLKGTHSILAAKCHAQALCIAGSDFSEDLVVQGDVDELICTIEDLGRWRRAR
jgi:hypothetical protein